jgi:hypothetical protein
MVKKKNNSKSIAMVVEGAVDIFEDEDFRGIVSEAVRFLSLSTHRMVRLRDPQNTIRT